MEAIVTDQYFSTLGIIDDFESFIWTERYSVCGDFALKVPRRKEYWSLLAPDNRVRIAESKAAMVIETLSSVADDDGKQFYIAAGRSLESLYDRRFNYDAWGNPKYNLSGPFVARQMLVAAFGWTPQEAERNKYNYIRVEDAVPWLDPKSTYYPAMEDVYSAVSKLAQDEKFGFDTTVPNPADQMMVTRLYAGTNRTVGQTAVPPIIFGEDMDNLMQSNFVRSIAGAKNVAVVFSGAPDPKNEDPKSRDWRQVDDTYGAYGLTRRILYVDANDIKPKTTALDQYRKYADADYHAALITRGRAELRKAASKLILDGEIDTYSTAFKYGKDFFMGDLVTLRNDEGGSDTVRITEYIRAQDVNGYREYPTFERDK